MKNFIDLQKLYTDKREKDIKLKSGWQLLFIIYEHI